MSWKCGGLWEEFAYEGGVIANERWSLTGDQFTGDSEEVQIFVLLKNACQNEIFIIIDFGLNVRHLTTPFDLS